jgi:hypothetical protein
MFKDGKLLKSLFFLLLVGIVTFMLTLIGAKYAIAVIILSALLSVLTSVIVMVSLHRR